MSNVNNQFLLSLLIIFLGYILKKAKIISEQDGESLSRVIFNVTLPCLIITTFSAIRIEQSLVMLIIISFVYGLSITALGLYGFRREGKSQRGMLSMLLPGFNIGMFAFPLIEAVWGQEGLKYFGMFDIGNAVMVFIVAYLVGSYFSEQDEKMDLKAVFIKMAKSLPLVIYIITCLANLLNLQFPSIILDLSAIIAKANMPLSLLLLGIFLNFSFGKDYLKNIGKVLLLRYALGISVGIALCILLPFDKMFKYTLLIGLILPISAASLPYAVEFNYDTNFVGTVSNITILVSFFLIWIIVGASSIYG